ncbi:MAG: hypothetical protein WBA57_19600 [Elainellaceae cyanobacterium]
MNPNRIISNAPQNLFELLQRAETERDDFSLLKTALMRYTMPELGGPTVTKGKQVSSLALEFLKTLSLSELVQAPAKQERYFDRIQASGSCRRRNRFYLKTLIEWATDNQWIDGSSRKSQEPSLNRLRSPVGTRKTYVNEVRSTTLKNVKSFALGTEITDYVDIDGQKVLANRCLATDVQGFETYVSTFRSSTDQIQQTLRFLYQLFGFLHRIQGVPLEQLSLACLVPVIQLQFSEQDVLGEESPDRAYSSLSDPIRIEQAMTMAEATARRRAKQDAQNTVKILDDFFQWRQEMLSQSGQAEGYSAATKRLFLDMAILVAKYQYREQTDPDEADNFEDIPVVKKLKRKKAKTKVDRHKTQKKIQKRCISWPQAVQIFNKQRQLALTYRLKFHDSRPPGSDYYSNRPETAIAVDVQKAVTLGLMTLIPTDRQQTYRLLKFGESLRNGYFAGQPCPEFVDVERPTTPDEASLWINLEQFKTAKTYGEFWYPIPNVQFSDKTTFYQLLVAWLWGFEDTKGRWPQYHRGKNCAWQGYVNEDGDRVGWRDALKPNHDYVLTMPLARTPYQVQTFSTFVKGIFVRFTQEEGEPVPVTPHSFRHMLSTYLDRLEIGDHEKQSFSYVLHHSPEMNQEHYVYRDNLTKINPAVERMNEIIKELI